MANTNAKNKTGAKKPAAGSGRKTSPAGKQPQVAGKPIRREIGAAVCFFLGLFSIIGYFNVDALFITYFCQFIKGLIGYGYIIFPPALLAAAVILLFHRGRPVVLRTVCCLLLPLILGALGQTVLSKTVITGLSFSKSVSALYAGGKLLECGGVAGGMLGIGLKAMFSVYGAVPVLIFVLAVLVMVSFRISPSALAQKAKNRPRAQYEPEPDPEPVDAVQPGTRSQGLPEQRNRKRAIDIPFDENDESAQEEYVERKIGFFNANPRVKTPDQVAAKHSARRTDTGAETLDPVVPDAAAEIGLNTADEPVSIKPSGKAADVAPMSVQEAAKLAGVTPVEIKTEEVRSAERHEEAGRKKMDPEELRRETEAVAKTVEENGQALPPEYRYPPIDLLRKGAAATVDGREEITINRARLQTTLDSFGVSAKISEITRGPTVTRYDLELDAGVKLAKLTNLSGDLALALGVSGVRIAAVPDKISTVGIEVPNKIVSTVYLRDIVASDAFKNASSKLTFAIGEDIGGNCICGNIAKLPHMLIAGTTGSGKSVCMNSLILSLLYKATPEEVKLIMIDPKMVELGIYNGIPHLYIPVVTDPKKAAGSLQWSVVEMLKRYRLFSEAGVRDIASYNTLQKKNGLEIIPQVVIVIDELADLMLVASKEVEESICRVAQMGRAAGMHLVIATQRPSADVITGLMKANIPSRIAFAVSSAMESRIILDAQGAEKLVGSGDMLYAPIGSGKPKRIQGAFVTDDERENVVNFIKENSEPSYNKDIIEQIEKTVEEKSAGTKAESVSDSEPASDYDELLPQAMDVIFETKQASVSMLQRRLKLGYSRAARIIDQMEEIGVVGPYEGSKPRQLMVTREQWQEMQLVNGTAPMEAPAQEQVHFDEYVDDAPENWVE